MGRKRIRAHANPQALGSVKPPRYPKDIEWKNYFPQYKKNSTNIDNTPKFADIGCGFGGFLTALSPHFPNKCIVGMEIRDAVVRAAQREISELQEIEKNKNIIVDDTTIQSQIYTNITVIHSNMMKFSTNYFIKGQLEKIFFLFPDPHFKRSKYRLRIINPGFLDYYAYCTKIDGILYTITDVYDLHIWMRKHLDEHPQFEYIEPAELKDDMCYTLMFHASQEGQKVLRNNGSMWAACYRRVEVSKKSEKSRINIFSESSTDLLVTQGLLLLLER